MARSDYDTSHHLVGPMMKKLSISAGNLGTTVGKAGIAEFGPAHPPCPWSGLRWFSKKPEAYQREAVEKFGVGHA